MAIETEQIVSLPIINPDTGRASRTFTFAGKVDLIQDGTLIDWKSTADPAAFIREKIIGFQPYLYALATEHAGKPIHTVEYRLVTKPTIRLCGKDKDQAAYEQRCYEWLQQEGKLVTYPLTLNPARLRAAREFLWESSKRILDSRRHKRWLPNENACNLYNKVCQYAPLCEGLAEGADVKWMIKEGFEIPEHIHPELEIGNRDTLTHTSLSTMTTCEQKFFWRYERGLRKRSDYSEPLWLGSAMHAGLEHVAEGGLVAAYAAIDEWESKNPAIGEDVQYVRQQVARARAMVRAAAEKWEVMEVIQ